MDILKNAPDTRWALEKHVGVLSINIIVRTLAEA